MFKASPDSASNQPLATYLGHTGVDTSRSIHLDWSFETGSAPLTKFKSIPYRNISNFGWHSIQRRGSII